MIPHIFKNSYVSKSCNWYLSSSSLLPLVTDQDMGSKGTELWFVVLFYRLNLVKLSSSDSTQIEGLTIPEGKEY